jgi:hypothetical protein
MRREDNMERIAGINLERIYCGLFEDNNPVSFLRK